MKAQIGHRISPWPPKAWGFQKLTLAALYYRPDLDTARAKWALARAKAVSAGAYPNPVLRLDPLAQFTSNAVSGLSPWTLGASVELPILTAGKLADRKNKARAHAEAARFDLVQTAWQIRASLRKPLIKLYTARHRSKLLAKKVPKAHALRNALRQRFQAGQVARYQLVQARVKLTHAKLNRADAQKAQQQARDAVAGAMGVPVVALSGIHIRLATLRDLPQIKSLPKSHFTTWALTQRPDIRAALMRYAASEQALKLAIARQYPNLQLGPGYQWDQGAHRWSIGLSLNLPVFNQNQGHIAQARARRKQAADRFRSLQAKIANQVSTTLTGYRASRHKLAVAQQLLQASKTRLASARASHQAGEIGRVNLLRTRLVALSNRLAVVKARAQAMQALGSLERALEHPLHPAASVLHAIQNVGTPPSLGGAAPRNAR